MYRGFARSCRRLCIMTNSAPRATPSRTPIRSKGQLLGGAFAYSLKLFPFLTGEALGRPPISRQIPDAKSRALQSLTHRAELQWLACRPIISSHCRLAQA